ncbi:MAG: hypothetical protein KAG98_05790 [Lentisphaeria bacterium]|nr:hypothetical protein [Lentisphaeria bacterium]
MNLFRPIFVLALTLSTLSSAEQSSSAEFLKEVRLPKLANTWAKMSGSAIHKREFIEKDGKVLQESMSAKAAIYLALKFRTGSLGGKVLFDNNELYTVRQVFSTGIDGAVSSKDGCLKKDADEMSSVFGISVGDLTLSFLYWDFRKELSGERVSTVSCRVFELENAERGEWVRVWLAESWRAPVKVQWFKKGAKEFYREAEFSSFTKVKNMKDTYMIKSFLIRGDSWKTIVKFDDFEVFRNSQKKAPKDLFPSLKK